MLVEHVWVNTLNPVRVVVADADIVKQGDDGYGFPDEQSLRLLQKFCSLRHVGLLVGVAEQCIVARAFPTGAIVAIVCSSSIGSEVCYLLPEFLANLRLLMVMGAIIDALGR